MDVLLPWKHADPLPLPGPCHSRAAGCHVIRGVVSFFVSTLCDMPDAAEQQYAILELEAEWGKHFSMAVTSIKYGWATHREDRNTHSNRILMEWWNVGLYPVLYQVKNKNNYFT